MPLLLLFLGCCSALYALIAPWIFHIFFPAYGASISFTQVYSLSFFSIVPGLIQAGLTSQRKTKQLYMGSFIIPAIKASLLIVLMYYFSVWGILWAQIITNFIAIPLQLSFLDGNKKVQTNI